jgi:rubredoxin
MEPLESTPERADFAAFFPQGSRATGQYKCKSCGYGITLHTKLPRCPMCGGEEWKQIPTGPFSRATEIQQ